MASKISSTKSNNNNNNNNNINNNNNNKLRIASISDRHQRHHHYGAGIGEGLPKVLRQEANPFRVVQQQRQMAGYADYKNQNNIMNVYDDTYFSIIGLFFACLGFVMIILLLFTPNNNHKQLSSLEGVTTGGYGSSSEQGGGGGTVKGSSISNSNRAASRLRGGNRSLKKKQDDFPYYDSDYEYDMDIVDSSLDNNINEHLLIDTNMKPPALTHRAPSTAGGIATANTSNNNNNNTATAATITTATTSPIGVATTRHKQVMTILSPPTSQQHHNANSFLHHPGLSGFLENSVDVDCSFEEDDGEQGSVNDEDDNSTKIKISTTATVSSGATSLLRNRKLSQNISSTFDNQDDFSSSSSPVGSNTKIPPYIPSLSLLSTPIAAIAPQEHHRPIPVYTSYSRSNSTNLEESNSISDNHNKNNINLPIAATLLPTGNNSMGSGRKFPVDSTITCDSSGSSGSALLVSSSPQRPKHVLSCQGEETPRMHNQNREKIMCTGSTHLKSTEENELLSEIHPQSHVMDQTDVGSDGWDFAYTSWNNEQDYAISTNNSVNSDPKEVVPTIPFVPNLMVEEDLLTFKGEGDSEKVKGETIIGPSSNKKMTEQQDTSTAKKSLGSSSAATLAITLPSAPSIQQQPQYKQQSSRDVITNQQKLLKEALLEVSSAAVSNPHAAASAIQHKRSNLIEESSDSTTSLSGNIKFKDLEIVEVIGGGGFGVVYKATWLGTPVAVKMLNYTTSKAVIQEFAAEINLLSGMRHPNICLYIGACLEPSNLAIVTELAVNGSLWDALRLPLQCGNWIACDGIASNGWVSTAISENCNGRFESSSSYEIIDANPAAIVPPIGTWPWALVKKVASGMARGMAYLHSGTPSILHRYVSLVRLGPYLADFDVFSLSIANSNNESNLYPQNIFRHFLMHLYSPLPLSFILNNFLPQHTQRSQVSQHFIG
jgi:hypothetical protein